MDMLSMRTELSLNDIIEQAEWGIKHFPTLYDDNEYRYLLKRIQGEYEDGNSDNS